MEQAVQRKTTTIVAADIAGYSRLIAEAEEETLHRLSDQRAVFEEAIGRCNGRIFNTAGDAIRAEYADPYDAFRCAIELQETLKTRNAAYPLSKQMNVRIGIARGEVVDQGGDLHGECVTLASSLEAVAPPGGICLSGDVHSAIADRVDDSFTDMGELRLKNHAERVRAYAVTIGQPVPVKTAGVKTGAVKSGGPSTEVGGAETAKRSVAGSIAGLTMPGFMPRLSALHLVPVAVVLALGGGAVYALFEKTPVETKSIVTATPVPTGKPTPPVTKPGSPSIVTPTPTLPTPAPPRVTIGSPKPTEPAKAKPEPVLVEPVKPASPTTPSRVETAKPVPVPVEPVKPAAQPVEPPKSPAKTAAVAPVPDRPPVSDRPKADPDWTAISARLRRLLGECGDQDSGIAVAGCRELLKETTLQPKDRALANLNLGKALQKSSLDQAFDAYSESIRLEPTAEAYNWRGLVYSEKSDWEKAIIDFTDAIKLNKIMGEAYNNRAWARFKANRATEAADDSKEAVRLLATAAYAWDTSGHINEKLGRREAAIADFRKAIAIDANAEDSRAGLKRLGATP
jgi:class 3 adenylate cyclase/Flp pilus assembly protein TadD